MFLNNTNALRCHEFKAKFHIVGSDIIKSYLLIGNDCVHSQVTKTGNVY